MQQEIFEVVENEMIANGVWRMGMYGDTSAITRPGQFVNIKLDGFFLRRPISVCDWTFEHNDVPGILGIIYKVVGHGTDAMTGLRKGDRLDVLTGLGNGYDITLAGDHPVLVGGGVGVPPLFGLARRLVAAGKPVDVILGFNTVSDVFCVSEFEELNDMYDFGCEGFEGERPEVKVHLATADGSAGTQGFVTDCVQDIEECSHYYACGPMPMLKALVPAMKMVFPKAVGSLSFEERMGCGFGACVGCSIETKRGFKKVCSDGPVFESTDVIL